MTTRRLKSCVEAWPGAYEGGYNPSCCRFPKSCSATVYDPEHVTDDDLEPPTPERTQTMRLPVNAKLPMLGRRAEIEVGGLDISSTCSAIAIRSTATDYTTVELTLLPAEVQLASEVDVTVSAPTRALLIALGWTPPDGSTARP